jgi:serine/threonine-protein kinase
MLSAGEVLQRGYVIDKVLGQGGMGAVYLARQNTLGGRRVAIKETTIRLDDAAVQAMVVEQFRKEAEILASIDHPNLVDVKDYFEENGSQYLVMAFIDGETLEEVLNRSPQGIPVEQVLAWMDQLCDVLMVLHEHQPPVIVRDLKPSNVMVDHSDRVRLIDFGIARVDDASGAKTSTFLKGAGTVGFAPVEQFGGGGTDVRTDVYALGATMYALLTRTIPPWSMHLATGEAVLRPPSSINPAVSPQLDAVIMRMMAVRRDQRFSSAREARSAMAAVRGTSQAGAPQVEVPRRFCMNCGATIVGGQQKACAQCGDDLARQAEGLSAAAPSDGSGGWATPPLGASPSGPMGSSPSGGNSPPPAGAAPSGGSGAGSAPPPSSGGSGAWAASAPPAAGGGAWGAPPVTSPPSGGSGAWSASAPPGGASGAGGGAPVPPAGGGAWGTPPVTSPPRGGSGAWSVPPTPPGGGSGAWGPPPPSGGSGSWGAPAPSGGEAWSAQQAGGGGPWSASPPSTGPSAGFHVPQGAPEVPRDARSASSGGGRPWALVVLVVLLVGGIAWWATRPKPDSGGGSSASSAAANPVATPEPSPDPQIALRGCESNLKNIGTALEMFSTDHSGHYPSKLDELTPNYLKSLPSCPAAGEMTYAYDSAQRPDAFTVNCGGWNHKDAHVALNYPYYDSFTGLQERNPALDLQPKDAQGYYDRGYARYAMGDYDGATNDFNKASELDSRWSSPIYLLGEVAFARKQYTEAINHYTVAIGLYKAAAYYESRAATYEQVGDYENALRDLLEADKLDKDNLQTYGSVAFVLYKMGKFKESIDICNGILKRDLKNQNAYVARYWCELCLGQGAAAATDAQAFLSNVGWTAYQSPYSVIVGYFGYMLEHREPEGKALLESGLSRLKHGWPYPCVQYLDGQITSEQLLGAAADVERQTEARCYLGLQAAIQGRKDDARKAFEWVRDQGYKPYFEYRASLTWLDRVR